MKLKLKHNLVVEFCYLITRVCNENFFDRHPIIQHYQRNEEVVEVIDRVRNEMSPFLKKDADYFVKNFTGSISIPLILSLENSYETPMEMIDAIDAMTPEEWLQFYLTLNDREELIMELSDQELKAIVEEHIMPAWDIPNRDSEMVLEIRRFAQESKDQIIQMYKRFYENHFLPLETFLLEKLNPLVQAHRKIMQERPKEFLEEILWMKEEEYNRVQDIQFIVTWIGELSHSVSIDGDRIAGIYGAGYLQRFDKEFMKRQTMKLFKVLSDERRLDILRLVGKKSRYATELAKELGLTKATVSYHMNLIIEQGLVTIRVEQNRVYYDLNVDRLGKQLTDVIKDLTGEE